MTLAHAAALRSEDPYRKVGAAALDADNRVIGTAYNGLYPGFKAEDSFWASRTNARNTCSMQEINLCACSAAERPGVVGMHHDALHLLHAALCAHGDKTNLLLRALRQIGGSRHRLSLRSGTDPGHGLSAQRALSPGGGLLKQAETANSARG